MIAALACCALILAGCDQPSATSASKPTSTSAPASASTSTPSDGDARDRLEFGPVYSVQQLADPVVEKAVQSVEITGTIVSAEIRGFLLDWYIQETSSSESILEYAVMKDGSLYRRAGMHRPSAAFGWVPPARLRPESSREANARNTALAAAHDFIAKRHPDFASVDPLVYNYLVRIHRKETSHVDIWVDPDGSKTFYNSLVKVVE